MVEVTFKFTWYFPMKLYLFVANTYKAPDEDKSCNFISGICCFCSSISMLVISHLQDLSQS
ncbi:MAG: hypothetical protein MJ203_05080 [archaeon]|nr:hypothetical protein [archaeon]